MYNTFTCFKYWCKTVLKNIFILIKNFSYNSEVTSGCVLTFSESMSLYKVKQKSCSPPNTVFSSFYVINKRKLHLVLNLTIM